MIKNTPRVDRSDGKSRILEVGHPKNVPTFNPYSELGPSFLNGIMFEHPIGNTILYNEILHEHHIWILLRVIGSGEEKQVIPGLCGFISFTGKKPVQKSTLEYFNPINEPFID